MVNNFNKQANDDLVRDLFSPYLDGEVTIEEQVLVEKAVAASPELGEELESLRLTVAHVSELSYIPAPRPFTLSEADVMPHRPVIRGFLNLPYWVSGLASLTALLLCVLVISFFTVGLPYNEPSASDNIAQSVPAADQKGLGETDRPNAVTMTQREATAQEEAAKTALADETPEVETMLSTEDDEPLSSPVPAASPMMNSAQKLLSRLPVWMIFLSGVTLGMILLTGTAIWLTIQNKD